MGRGPWRLFYGMALAQKEMCKCCRCSQRGLRRRARMPVSVAFRGVEKFVPEIFVPQIHVDCWSRCLVKRPICQRSQNWRFVHSNSSPETARESSSDCCFPADLLTHARLPEVIPLMVLLETVLDADQYAFLGSDQTRLLEHLVMQLVRCGWVESLVSGLESLVSRGNLRERDCIKAGSRAPTARKVQPRRTLFVS